MDIVKSTRWIWVAGVVLLTASQAAAAENLGEILREAKWDGIVGTWVDPDTKNATKFSWKFRDQVIEIRSKESGKESIGLMGVNGKTGKVFHMGADSEGTSVLGEWEFEEDDAVLNFLFTDERGQEGAMSVKYHRTDADNMVVTVHFPGVPEPVYRAKLVRLKLKEKSK